MGLVWLAALSAAWSAHGWYKSSHRLSVQRSNSSTSPRTDTAFTQWIHHPTLTTIHPTPDKPKLALGGKAVRASMARNINPQVCNRRRFPIDSNGSRKHKMLSFVHNIAVLHMNTFPPFPMPSSNLIGFSTWRWEGTICVRVIYLFITKIILKVQWSKRKDTKYINQR